jgi:5-methylcytosine-specific restriction endonuclease McrA
MTRADASKYDKWRGQSILIEEPPITSPAALVFLTRKMFTMDKSIFSNFRMLRLRDKWMLEQQQKSENNGELTCAICGRKGLNPFISNKNILATLDHIVSIGKGGSWNDTSNFQVACYQCNMKKG